MGPAEEPRSSVQGGRTGRGPPGSLAAERSVVRGCSDWPTKRRPLGSAMWGPPVTWTGVAQEGEGLGGEWGGGPQAAGLLPEGAPRGLVSRARRQLDVACASAGRPKLRARQLQRPKLEGRVLAERKGCFAQEARGPADGGPASLGRPRECRAPAGTRRQRGTWVSAPGTHGPSAPHLPGNTKPPNTKVFKVARWTS